MTRQVATIGNEDRRERYVLRGAFEDINFASEALHPNMTSAARLWTDLGAQGVMYAQVGGPIVPWVSMPNLSGVIEVPDRLTLQSSGTNLPNTIGVAYAQLGIPVGTWAYMQSLSGTINVPDRLTLQSSGTNLANAFVVEVDPPYRVGTAGVSRAVEGASVRESVRKTIDRLFVIAESEHFEDGMESNLTIGLATALRQYPRQTFGILKAELSVRRLSQRILIELLHFLGRFRGRGIADEQFSVVAAYLYHASPVIRDAAAVGLAYLRDKRAIPVLEKVIAGEKINSLREDMEVVLAELTM